MAELQTQFNKFHETIKIDFDGNKPLRDKRDLIVGNLRDGLKKLYPTNTPTFDSFNQGSYDLSTGIEPLAGEDYDIDVGIIFNILKDDNNPVGVKEIVYKILDTVHQRKVEIKRPCVRVQYHKQTEKYFHVDLAIYASGKNIFGQKNDTLYLAKGFPGSSQDKKVWEESEPFKLKELLKSKISDNSDREQFRRIIRYLKRWKDYNFSANGTERPTGIALTACCYHLFSVQKDFNYSTLTYQYNDLKALLNVVNGIANTFGLGNRISVELPVIPHNDLFEKLSDKQMLNFKIKLNNFKTILTDATRDTQVTTACYRLRGAFGGDFPSY